MSNFKTMTITCTNCNARRNIKIVQTASGEMIDWLETPELANHPIVSARKRLDGQWGFQCQCGNNDILTDQERRTITNPAEPDMKQIDEVIKNLVMQPPKFEMREA